MGGHGGLHRYFQAKEAERAQAREMEKNMVKQEITRIRCSRCDSFVKVFNKYFYRCPSCALMKQRNPLPGEEK